MKRLNDFKFYDLGLRLQPIEEISRETAYKERFHELWFARAAVTEFLTVFPELNICRNAAMDLVRVITECVPDDWKRAGEQEMETKFGYRAYSLQTAKQAFEHILSAELTSLDTYVITQQGIYSTRDLVERAEMSFSEKTRKIISGDAKKDFREGGRCLAFELPTASGYHTIRATEAVLRQYHRLATNLAATAKSPEMAQCINELTKAGEDKKVMNILDAIRHLHRNPQMHPEAFLTMDEAASLFDIAKSAINAMAMRIGELETVSANAVALGSNTLAALVETYTPGTTLAAVPIIPSL